MWLSPTSKQTAHCARQLTSTLASQQLTNQSLISNIPSLFAMHSIRMQAIRTESWVVWSQLHVHAAEALQSWKPHSSHATTRMQKIHDNQLILTRTDVIMWECPCSTATGFEVWRHHMRINLSQLPAASNVLDALHAMSVISAACPRIVHSSRPLAALQTFTRWSSAPYPKSSSITG